MSQELLACPVCRSSASCIWIDERRVFLVECENCTTFTITEERSRAFQDAWHSSDRQVLMCLEAISRYLRLGGEDCDREITAATGCRSPLRANTRTTARQTDAPPGS